jgi:transposase
MGSCAYNLSAFDINSLPDDVRRLKHVPLILDEVKAGGSAPPLLNALHTRMIESVSQVDEESNLTAVFNCAQDALLEIDNKIAERSIRMIGSGRRNYSFFGSDGGGGRAAIIYSLTDNCKLNHIDQRRYLYYARERIVDHPINRIEEPVPWNVAETLNQSRHVAAGVGSLR